MTTIAQSHDINPSDLTPAPLPGNTVNKMENGNASRSPLMGIHRDVLSGVKINSQDNRPKSSKVLIRKNTPALLPKIEKIYAKDVVSSGPALAEEEEEVDTCHQGASAESTNVAESSPTTESN